nr:hypothetical protein CFP56_72510 [Quercus suber]
MTLDALQNFLSQLRRRSKDNIHEHEGLVWISVWPLESTLGEDFQSIVTNLLIPKLLRSESVSLVWNVQNTRPGARGGDSRNGYKAYHGGPRALLTRFEDLNAAKSSTALRYFSNNDIQRRPSSRASRAAVEIFATELRTYEAVQRYEGLHGTKTEGQDAEIDDWYRNQHLAEIAATTAFLRTTRYKLKPELVSCANDHAPRFLAIHECRSTQALLEHAMTHGKIVPESPRSDRIFNTAISVERQIWEINGRHIPLDRNLSRKLDGL